MPKHKHKFRNHIQAVRRNRQCSQKRLARLLGHRDTQMVSRYEQGHSLPPTRTALLLQVILGVHISDLYPDLFKELQRLAIGRESPLNPKLGRQLRERVLRKD